MPNGVKLTGLSYLGLAIETVLGTPVAPTAWIPVVRFGPQDAPQYIPDEGMRGIAVKEYGMYLGPKSSTYRLEGMFYPNSGGNLLSAVWGHDTVTGTTPGPYTHTFSLVGQGVPSYTISDDYNAQARQFPGARCDSLQLRFTPEAGLSYQANFIGFPSATWGTPGAATWESEPFLLGWEASAKIGGTTEATLSSFTATIARDGSRPLFAANNSQSPFDIFVGPMTIQYSLEFYMEDDTQYSLALAQATDILALTVTQDTNDVLTLTSSAVQWTQPTIDRGSEWVLVTLDGTAVYNATDAGVGTATLKNSVQTPYSTTAGN